MKKEKSASAIRTKPLWLENLRNSMEKFGYNPRSLSLRAGLNPTAVRDILEGRTNFPRYDTLQALARALETTPARLMGDEEQPQKTSTSTNTSLAKTPENAQKTPKEASENIDMLVEIITRLQEESIKLGKKIDAKTFALMAASIYRQMQNEPSNKRVETRLQPKISDLLAYEALKQRTAR